MAKTSIIVHNPCNEITRYIRNYNFFWDYFTEYLKQFFDVEENRYYEHIHKEPYKINLKKGTHWNLTVLDCEYVIENKETGEFHVISVSDVMSSMLLNEAHNPFCKTILVSQYNPRRLFYYKDTIPYKDLKGVEIKEYSYKYKPWVYFQAMFQNLDMLYYKRKSIAKKSDILYFRGSSLNERTFLDHIDKKYVTEFNSVSPDYYFNEIINHKIAISIDGKGEFCYRDVECLGMGIPFIRYEYKSVFDSFLIPNYHYISIPRPPDMTDYAYGTKEHADVFIKRYLDVVNNEEFLSFISANARKYYEDNFVYDKIADRTFDLLNLKSWIK